MYLSMSIVWFMIGIIIGYIGRGVKIAIIKRRIAKEKIIRYEEIRKKAIMERDSQARKLHPEVADNEE